jgi:hypothetical protein
MTLTVFYSHTIADVFYSYFIGPRLFQKSMGGGGGVSFDGSWDARYQKLGTDT